MKYNIFYDQKNFLKYINIYIFYIVIYAWNPSDNILTYHGGNRGAMKVNFFADVMINEMLSKRKRNLLSHGIGMFLVWG